MPLTGMNDPRQTIGLAQTTAAPNYDTNLNWQDMATSQNFYGGNDMYNMIKNAGYGGNVYSFDSAFDPNAGEAGGYTNTYKGLDPAFQQWLKDKNYSFQSAYSGDNDAWKLNYGLKDLGSGNMVAQSGDAGDTKAFNLGKKVTLGLLGGIAGGAALSGMGALGSAGEAAAAGDAMGGSAGTLGAVDSQAANAAMAGNSIGYGGMPGFAQGGLGAGTTVPSAVTDAYSAAMAGVDPATSAAWSQGAAGLGGDTLSAMGAAQAAAPAASSGIGGMMGQAGQLWDKYSGLFGGAKGLGQIVSGAADLYGQSQAKKGYQNIINQAGGNDQAYVDQMREQLMRQDAARGRRSDYGSREVQLRAKLAELQSARLPGMLQAQGGINAANQGTLKDILQIGSQVPWDKVGGWLGGMFGG